MLGIKTTYLRFRAHKLYLPRFVCRNKAKHDPTACLSNSFTSKPNNSNNTSCIQVVTVAVRANNSGQQPLASQLLTAIVAANNT